MPAAPSRVGAVGCPAPPELGVEPGVLRPRPGAVPRSSQRLSSLLVVGVGGPPSCCLRLTGAVKALQKATIVSQWGWRRPHIFQPELDVVVPPMLKVARRLP